MITPENLRQVIPSQELRHQAWSPIRNYLSSSQSWIQNPTNPFEDGQASFFQEFQRVQFSSDPLECALAVALKDFLLNEQGMIRRPESDAGPEALLVWSGKIAALHVIIGMICGQETIHDFESAAGIGSIGEFAP